MTKVSYGPHIFPDPPTTHIRGDKKPGAHERIRRTLEEAFGNQEGSVFSQIAGRFGFKPSEEVNLAFLNYGNTELVYLADIGWKHRCAVLINQPRTPRGTVRKEYENLRRLAEIDSRFVVNPLAYFSSGEHELYASEYIPNAICIAARGFYNPLPFYHFERFSPEMQPSVNSAMIAMLVNYYDEVRKRGVAETEISGNDFMLTQSFRRNKKETILPNIRMIAARGYVEASFKEYLDILRREFKMSIIRGDPRILSEKLKVNHRSETRMCEKEIEEGIRLGIELRTK